MVLCDWCVVDVMREYDTVDTVLAWVMVTALLIAVISFVFVWVMI